MAALAGAFRWRTTTYSFGDETVRLRQGLLSVKEVEIPFARVQAVDVEQGPIQRLFGVYKVQVQTGGGGAGGEIELGALDDREIARLRDAPAARPARRRRARRRAGRARAPAVRPPARARGGDLGPAHRAAAGRGGGRPDRPAALRGPGRGRADDRRRPARRRDLLGAAGDGPARARVAAGGARHGRRRSAASPSAASGDELRIRRGLAAAPPGDAAGGPRAGGARDRERAAAGARAGGAARRGDRARGGAGRGADAVPAAARAPRSSRSCASCCPSWPTGSTACSRRRGARCGATRCRRSP